MRKAFDTCRHKNLDCIDCADYDICTLSLFRTDEICDYYKPKYIKPDYPTNLLNKTARRVIENSQESNY